jgi:hypothetical protein
VDLDPGGSDTEGRLVAVGVSVCVPAEGLTLRALVALLEDRIASAMDVKELLWLGYRTAQCQARWHGLVSGALGET